MTDDVRHLTGEEGRVLFRDGDTFTGVDEAWLRSRLRLDPGVGELDLFERFGPIAYLDDDQLEDLDLETILGAGTGELCTYGDDDIIGGRYDLYGMWLEAWAAEMRWNLTWLGPGPHDYPELALAKIREGMESWEPRAEDTFVVTSPYLCTSNQQHRDSVLMLACDAGVVLLNDERIR